MAHTLFAKNYTQPGEYTEVVPAPNHLILTLTLIGGGPGTESSHRSDSGGPAEEPPRPGERG